MIYTKLNKTLRASIIVPTRNREDLLENALDSFISQKTNPDEFEILVIDNGSDDGTPRVVQNAIDESKDQRIHYFQEPIPGLLSGRHRGALEASGEVLIFVDDDIVADPRWLDAILETFNQPEVQIVGGRSLPVYEVEPPSWLKVYWHKDENGWCCGHLSLLDFGDEVKEIDPAFVWGLNFAIRKHTLFDLGGFCPDCIPKDLQRFQGNGESGLAHRASAKGVKVMYQPQALVHHHVPARRLTVEYFEERQFYQGVCDSYTKIRSAGGVPSAPLRSRRRSQPLKRRIRRLVKRLFRLAPDAGDHDHRVHARIQRAYEAGYAFHQNEVRTDPELLQWVLKEDYWDYRLPLSSPPDT